jgi:hypothetical protein
MFILKLNHKIQIADSSKVSYFGVKFKSIIEQILLIKINKYLSINLKYLKSILFFNNAKFIKESGILNRKDNSKIEFDGMYLYYYTDADHMVMLKIDRDKENCNVEIKNTSLKRHIHNQATAIVNEINDSSELRSSL